MTGGLMQLAHTHEHHPDAANENLPGWLKTALLLGLGLYFVYNILSGNLTNYINVRFAWLSYVAAILFLLIGGYSAYHMLRHHSSGEHHHDHAHTPMSLGALLVIAIPLILGTLIPSRPLGAEAVDGNVSLTSAAATTTTTFTINPQDRNVLDWLRVFNSTEDYSEINGQPADVIGFVYTEPTFGDDQFMVARFTISCCVADASAIGLPTYWQEMDTLEQGQWVRVQGTMQLGQFRDDSLPILQATSVEVIDQPEHPYLYP
jgi:uncharacterized repeat protein (TIGR03943 family)